MPTTRAILEKLGSLSDLSGTMLEYSWTDDLLRVYVYGSQDAAAFISRAQWVLATFTVLLEDSAAFKSALEKTLEDLGAAYSIAETKDLSLGIAELEAKVFVTNM